MWIHLKSQTKFFFPLAMKSRNEVIRLPLRQASTSHSTCKNTIIEATTGRQARENDAAVSQEAER
jgi:hypothetical protein